MTHRRLHLPNRTLPVQKLDTGFVRQHFSPEKLERPFPCDDATAAELILGAVDRLEAETEKTMPSEGVSAWRMRAR